MATSNKGNKKKERRDLAIKQARRKKIVILAVVLLVILSLVAYFVITAIMSSGAEVFSDGFQTVSLQSNGNFIANLAHSVTYRGTYTLSEQNDITIVSFTHSGVTVESEIENEQLSLPEAWWDTCGHGTVLPKR